MKVLVTGASGMLGRAVATSLLARGDEVTVLQRSSAGLPGAREVLGSVDDPDAVEIACTGQEAVIHLAAKVSFTGPAEDFQRINIRGTWLLLDGARRAGATRFVQVSSPSVAHTGGSLVCQGAGPADPLLARGSYARTKAVAELEALGADGPGFAVVAVRPHIVWGPGDTQLVQRVVDRAAAGRLPLIGSGAPLVDTTYVDNAAAALVAALDRAEDAHGEAFVVTNGEPRPVRDIMCAWCRAAGVRPPAWSVPPRAARLAGAVVEAAWTLLPEQVTAGDEPPMTRFLAEQLSTAHWFDLRRTREALSWAPEVSFDDGVARLADFYAQRAGTAVATDAAR
ncbi:NAD-dependent epimerase/dehydratase family protein [Georgenia halophila]|uniref:NAD-dependent epimerase/dehydratase family protein n=1 Tax=Georgenia halophila TaxID=620889 RepID=A0ABP8LPV2_9MICO